MALADLRVRTAKATGKIYTLGDDDGLSLFVSAKGKKAWHFRYYGWASKRGYRWAHIPGSACVMPASCVTRFER